MLAKRKTLVFGNGLGMAINPAHFLLENAIRSNWDDENVLDEESKILIRACLTRRSIPPKDEDELDILQASLFACELLQKLQPSPEAGQFHWLSEHGQRFPRVVRKFIYRTARTFHMYDDQLPEAFVKSLSDFIRKSKSHVATLNYDDLLYRPMIVEKILDGYNGSLVDGILDSGFVSVNLERRPPKTFGYYLHLHGSPLFFEKDGRIYKSSPKQLKECSREESSSHIVLTNISHKSTVISASDLLMSYWNYFGRAIRESEEILLIGYSGQDKHLNKKVRENRGDKPVRIVEWAECGSLDVRKSFWEIELGKGIELVHKKSVLEFVDW